MTGSDRTFHKRTPTSMPVLLYIRVFVIFFKWLFMKEPQPLHGVYRQRGKWYYLKYLIAYFFLWFRKWRHTRSQAASAEAAGYGVKSRSNIQEMECPQTLSAHEKAVDAIYLSGYSPDGCYFVTAMSRWHKNAISGFWFLWIPEVGLLEAPNLPDTVLYTKESMKFAVDGLSIEPVEPMKKWQITYDGIMKHTTGELVNVNLKFLWSSDLQQFDFDTDMPPAPMAKAIAKEIWTREYFESLRKSHQTHYEQMGTVRGTVQIEGSKTFNLCMKGYRDHSYDAPKLVTRVRRHFAFIRASLKLNNTSHMDKQGIRDWKHIHRYGLHSVALEDGTKFTVGIVSQPINLSTLEIGYLYTPQGELHGVDWCDLPLHCHGEDGTPPTDYAFSFKAGGRVYNVQVNVLQTRKFYVGLDWEATFFERFCTFDVDGTKGRGISEWEYRYNLEHLEVIFKFS